jgi:hypothetical protein
MKQTIVFLGLAVRIGLMTSLAASTIAGAAAAPIPKKTITCPFLEEGRVTFDVPARLGSLPKEIDFDYPVKAASFSFRDGNLLLVAMDESERSRVRVVISAQLNKNTGAYEGQIFVDMGGSELMLHNWARALHNRRRIGRPPPHAARLTAPAPCC